MEDKDYRIINGNMLEELDKLEENSIDNIITDPPYELGFMGKSWDSTGIAFNKTTWEKCLRVLKPGGYLLAFGGSRTFYRIGVAIEDAGFEIRDTIMWMYGSGFPKSMNIGLAIDNKNGVESPVIGVNEDILKKQAKDLKEGHRKILDSFDAGAKERNNGFKTVSADIKEAQNEWKGWGTQLKPAFEPVVIARKPFKGSLLDNIDSYRVGGFNIDECRVPANSEEYDIRHYTNEDCFQNLKPKESKFQVKPQSDGRFPSNVILTYDEVDKDEVCGGFPVTGQGGNTGGYSYSGSTYSNSNILNNIGDKPTGISNYDDIGSAARYYYCAKANARDRDEGLDEFIEKEMKVTSQYELPRDDGSIRNVPMRKNIHPTVKPTELMQYLVRLVSPKGATILDPFMGSGSTGKAVMYENVDRNANYKFIGIEREKEYCEIAEARIVYAKGDRVVRSINKETGEVEQKVERKIKQSKLF